MTPGDRTVHYHNLRMLIDRALAQGAKRLPAAEGARFPRAVFEWNTARDCQAPVTRDLHADPPRKDRIERGIVMRDASPMWYADPGKDQLQGVVVSPGKRHSLQLRMEVPCRKCDRCRARRARMWAIRAMHEFRAGSDEGCRTWFGTLTLDPTMLHIARETARRRVAENEAVLDRGEIVRDDWDALSEGDAMQRIHAVISPLITRYLKRVRKGALPKWAVTLPRYEGFEPHKTHFRFLCAAELGDRNGRLHYHLLIHEQERDAVVRHALLETQWAQVGFSNWKLVRTPYGAAHYVSKYVSKRAVVRVRASANYGNNERGIRPIDITKGVRSRPVLSQAAIDGQEARDGVEAPKRPETVEGPPSMEFTDA